MNTKCIKINNDILENLKNEFNKNINIRNIQTYFPIMSLFFEFYNNSTTNFILNSNFLVKDLIEPIEQKKLDSYIKFFFKASILNQNNNETFEKDIFIKILPILNISQTMMDEYKLDNSILPNIFSSLTSKKINNYNNSAYIDSFFSYLGSILTEQGKCPTFPLFYGTFSGIADEFKHDISEDYNSIKNTSWFRKNINTKFKIHNIDLDRSDNKSFKKTNINDMCQDIDDILNDETLDENTESLDVNNESLDENNESLDENTESLYENNESLDENNESLDENTESLDENTESLDENNDSLDENNNESDENNEDSDDNKNIIPLKDDSILDIEIDNISFDEINLSNYDKLSINSGSNISLSDSEIYEINYCCIENYPVQINCIEKLEYTLDNYIENTKNNIHEVEWKSILFQICFGLSIAQKQYDFVHNDLHSSNIMFKKTELEFLYYNFKGNCFKIPTFGKITKIIDFGRATFNYKNKVFFSDVFKKHGDAEGQYSYPYLNNLKNCKIKPNKSFDLSRLATTIIEHFDEDSNIYRLLKLWCMDKYGNFLMNLDDDFNLYRIIAKNVKSAVPKNQINKLIFKEFLIEKEDIKNEYIYNY